jgi:fumarate reductase subunit C
MLTLRLFMLQRATALVMAPLVLGHLAVMIYAVRGGLSAGEILSRTQGSTAWALFYGCFVVAVCVHAAIGVRVIAFEMLRLRGALLNMLSLIFFAALLVMGLRAVLSVTSL